MVVHRFAKPARVLLALAIALSGVSVDAVPVAADGGPAPCSVGDALTRYREPSDWYRSVLDTRLRLRRSYTPRDLVPIARAGVAGGGSVRRLVISDLAAMHRAARKAGAPFAATSAYRSYSTQVSTFWYWVRRSGLRQALLTSARPGHSEHQLGTALDFMTPGAADPWYHADWGTTRAGAWLRRNSWRYGFVMSYPKASSPKRTCYAYEPWHFRYVGRRIAALVHASGLAPREWLWRNGATATWTGGGPHATPAPSPSPTGEPTPTGEPSPTGEPTPEPSSSPAGEPTPEPTPEPSISPPIPSASVEPATPAPAPTRSLEPPQPVP